jgi:16S rRNA (cytosine1402-N4)-methyltransferase
MNFLMLERRPRPMDYVHIPVLVGEVVSAFDFPGEACVVDATLGLGGHAQALLDRFPRLSILGIEWDGEALERASKRLEHYGSRFKPIEGSYADLPALLHREHIEEVDGILLDLGVSSLQLDKADRGFSFNKKGPLDMRMSKSLSWTAWDVLNRFDEGELTRIFKVYGEERFAHAVAKTLKAALERGQLANDSSAVANCIRASVPVGRGRIDPATRCFQALRMVVNHEIDNIDKFLENLPSLLKIGGRSAVISFHSLEDRAVKRSFAQAAKGCVCPPQIPQCVCGKVPWAKLISKKAIQATPEETQANPRARSAKMRLLERIA